MCKKCAHVRADKRIVVRSTLPNLCDVSAGAGKKRSTLLHIVHHVSNSNLERCGINIEVALLLATLRIRLIRLKCFCCFIKKKICYFTKDSLRNHFEYSRIIHSHSPERLKLGVLPPITAHF